MEKRARIALEILPFTVIDQVAAYLVPWHLTSALICEWESKENNKGLWGVHQVPLITFLYVIFYTPTKWRLERML